MSVNIIYQTIRHCKRNAKIIRRKILKRRKIIHTARFLAVCSVAFVIPIAALPKSNLSANEVLSPTPVLPSAIELSNVAEVSDPIELPDFLEFSIYDVPLSAEQQHKVVDIAKIYGVDPVLIFGVMYTESGYNTNALSKDGGDVGVMQINKRNFNWLHDTLGTTNLRDFEQSVECGAYLLSLYTKKFDSTTKILMCYHYGEAGAKRLWEQGIVTDPYCEKTEREIERIRSSY